MHILVYLSKDTACIDTACIAIPFCQPLSLADSTRTEKNSRLLRQRQLRCVSIQVDDRFLKRRATVADGLYDGLADGAGMASQAWDAKMKLLVEAPAAVEDALASLLDHPDLSLRVGHHTPPPPPHPFQRTDAHLPSQR